MNEHTLRKQVNASGFPFQIRVKHEIKASYKRHGWLPVAPEHRWANTYSGTEGFIDLILRKGISPLHSEWYMVIECKRARGGNWVFLKSHTDNEVYDAHVLLARRMYSETTSPLWIRCSPAPMSSVSSFCTVPGQGDRGIPMLERISTELLDSVESLAEKQMSVDPALSENWPETKAFYIPVIVTNTELVVCQFEPEAVDLSEGVLKDDSGTFQTVPFIRFQKSFITRFATRNVPMSLQEANKENKRTILVVHAPSLPDFLQRWDFDL